jgi:hypothetical protein
VLAVKRATHSALLWLDPMFDSFRKNVRFQKLVASESITSIAIFAHPRG